MTGVAHGGSLQRRITVSTTIAVAVVIAISGLLVHRMAGRRLRAASMTSLETVLRVGYPRAALAAANAARRGDAALPDFVVEGSEDHEWLVREPEGGPGLAGSLGFPGIRLPALRSGPDGTGDVRFVEGVTKEGQPWRFAGFLCRPADARRREPERGMPPRGGRPEGRGPRGRPAGQPQPFRPDESYDVWVASSIAEDEQELAALARLLGIAGLLAVAGSAVLIRSSVRAGLRPLGDLSRQVAELDAQRLDVGLDLPEAPLELAPIVEELDSARGRLASAFERERRFTSDAAHELRTPLAGLRSTLEVALRRERTVPEHRSAAEQCLAITLGMQETVTVLLQLVRGGGRDEDQEAVDLRAALERAFEEHGRDAAARGLTVRTAPGPAAKAVVRPGLLARALDNVVRNAISHAREGSTLDATFASDGEIVTLVLANEAEVLPDDIGERAFEPFWRADSSRSGHGAHVGLGLSLVQQCASAMGGRASIETREAGPGPARFAISLRLPQAS